MENSNRIIVYDQGCNLCAHAVSFIEKHDRGNTFTLIPFQSEAGRRYAAMQHTDPENPHSVLLVEDGIIYDRSKAGIKIAGQLKGTRMISRVLTLLPEKFSDFIYRLIARHRHRLLGRNDKGRVDREGPGYERV